MSAEYAEGIRFIDGMVAPPTHGFALPDTRSAELFRDRWVCLVDARNPALDAGRLRLEDLARLPWVAPYYRSPPNPSAAPIMHQLELLDIRPRIAVRVESYLAVPHFVAGTDRIALMQERLAARLADRMDLAACSNAPASPCPSPRRCGSYLAVPHFVPGPVGIPLMKETAGRYEPARGGQENPARPTRTRKAPRSRPREPG